MTGKINEVWENEHYEIDFSEFTKEELENIMSRINCIIAFNRGE